MTIWPQITWFALMCVGMGFMLHKDKSLSDYIGTFLSTGLQIGLLYAGGFFSPILQGVSQ